jgi:hypothetical protein
MHKDTRIQIVSGSQLEIIPSVQYYGSYVYDRLFSILLGRPIPPFIIKRGDDYNEENTHVVPNRDSDLKFLVYFGYKNSYPYLYKGFSYKYALYNEDTIRIDYKSHNLTCLNT